MTRCCCDRSCSDVAVVSALVLTTVYSAHGFYAYLFPHTLGAIAAFVVSPVEPVSVEALFTKNTTASTAGGNAIIAAPPVQVRALSTVSGWSWALFTISVVLLAMTTWAYIMAVCTPPGRVPAVFRQRARQSAPLALATFYEPLPWQEQRGPESALYPNNAHPSRTARLRIFSSTRSSVRNGGESPMNTSLSSDRVPEHFFFNPGANSYTSVRNHHLNYCPMCTSYKPPRAHHCSRCNFCVLKYDHHCPWLGQCVGFFNYKNYLLVLLYVWLLTSWVLTLLTAAVVLYTTEVAVSQKALGTPPFSSRLQRVAEELRVGRPTVAVFVCYAEALLFFVMSSYLLRRHFTYARHNFTTIDVVIRENERHLCRPPDLSEDEEAADTVIRSRGKLRDGTPRQFTHKNPYDVGVKRNLMQVFGDAVLNDDVDAAGEEFPRVPYFTDLMEGSEAKHKNPLVRWFWRLLPFPAYPDQMEWRPVGQPGGATYGSSGDATGRHILEECGAVEEQLLGLRFPTKSSLGIP